MHSRRAGRQGQAAFEYIVTYGWAILAAIIAIGALSYFGFISPSNLIPNRCNFGKQLECQDYQIQNDGTGAVVRLNFRNNFGKPIIILDVNMVEDSNGVTGNHPFDAADQVYIAAGATNETVVYLDPQYARLSGEKQGVNLMVNFTRADIPSAPEHTISGYVFTVVSE
ncbi:hypothetical protein JW711_00375 [Candidatus Woesearchaeota archaeon]|nr:hypothetical protein [Candidatus Woesearchaeota archaeon]